jgi:hypothetical protein
LGDPAWFCERCGRPAEAGEAGRLRETVEQERLDYTAEVEAHAQARLERRRGRQHWFSNARRDPAVVLTTPRYRYVRRMQRICQACDEAIAAHEAETASTQRRMAMAVAGGVIVLALGLLALRSVWPGALGIERPTPVQADARQVPPSTEPYKPPFDANTAMEGQR